MAYGIGHLSSSTGSKCVVCGKQVSTYVSVADYTKSGFKRNTEIVIPVCDGNDREIVTSKKDIIIAYAKSLNELFKAVK